MKSKKEIQKIIDKIVTVGINTAIAVTKHPRVLDKDMVAILETVAVLLQPAYELMKTEMQTTRHEPGQQEMFIEMTCALEKLYNNLKDTGRIEDPRIEEDEENE
jgi:hypothetical protein